MAYATAADYRATPGVPEVPDDALLQETLQQASERLDELLLTAVYAVDQAGEPTAPAVVALFRRLTIKQAAYATANPDAAAGSAPEGAVTLGPLQLPATSGQEGVYAPGVGPALIASGLVGPAVLGAWATW